MSENRYTLKENEAEAQRTGERSPRWGEVLMAWVYTYTMVLLRTLWLHLLPSPVLLQSHRRWVYMGNLG